MLLKFGILLSINLEIYMINGIPLINKTKEHLSCVIFISLRNANSFLEHPILR
jgi:hypothetical protein